MEPFMEASRNREDHPRRPNDATGSTTSGPRAKSALFTSRLKLPIHNYNDSSPPRDDSENPITDTFYLTNLGKFPAEGTKNYELDKL